MNLFKRLAIGTANWQKEYNGARVSDDDQRRILDYAQCSGIDLIDTATAYGVDWTRWNSYFKKVVKVRKGDDIKAIVDTDPYAIMAHREEEFDWLRDNLMEPWGFEKAYGVSIYNPEFDTDFDSLLIEVPYSLYDRRFEDRLAKWHGMYGATIIARSIFLRGKILEKTMPQDCIKFVLCNPHVDRVIIGADTFEQFKENVHFIHEWNRMEKNDERLLDPRLWEKEQHG